MRSSAINNEQLIINNYPCLVRFPTALRRRLGRIRFFQEGDWLKGFLFDLYPRFRTSKSSIKYYKPGVNN
ncbi:hypothetical protein [Crocosphaera watsonii]|uniref:Uncharacterized protein n=1 Tax=Crocosphaera watsonii WH 0401 TaxID=555881 RepID=T2JE35_CROWT|nr:hypothetical protein [Crocosphaera watsonii]CCQ64113.1 hypothetical protein CWATWH0401_661 [Crocosphaera watsonii WH 0401]